MKQQMVLGAVVLATAVGFLASAVDSAADEVPRQESPLIPRPFDPRTDRMGADSTSELNMVGRPGVVIPDIARQRAQHPIGGRQSATQAWVSRLAVLDRVRAMIADVKRIDRIEAKLTTWGELLQVHAPGLVPTKWDPARTLWVVAVAGAVQPVGARGHAFDWAIYLFDATTGDVVFSNANSNGPWPAHFDRLIDRGP